MSRNALFFVIGGLLVTFLGGVAVAQFVLEDDEPIAVAVDTAPTATATVAPQPEPTAVSEAEPTSTPVATPTPVPTLTVEPTPPPTPEPPAVLVTDTAPPPLDRALAISRTLAPSMVLPSDCGLPLDVPASLPNSSRAYRAGIHQGIDFICLQRGRTAVAALEGRVVMAVGDYVDPVPVDRSAILTTAAAVGSTPMWTLAMLYGNFVVIDHGVVPDVGHLITIYAHFDSLAEGIQPGVQVRAGEPLGEIGNLGTEPASTGADNPRSLHLHWEIHVDSLYLGAGLGVSDTREVYATLFGS